MGPDAWKSQSLPVAADRDTSHPQGTESASAKLTVVALGVVGAVTLLIAIVNYVNLATARAGLRAREVAMRKVLGADRARLIRQFLGEAVLTVALAALLGLILAELGLPLINAAGGLSLHSLYAGGAGAGGAGAGRGRGGGGLSGAAALALSRRRGAGLGPLAGRRAQRQPAA
jgi:putative ABC transport system permease protein